MFDVESAYRDGKQPKDVADYLASIHGFDADAARKDGKSDEQIASYLARLDESSRADLIPGQESSVTPKKQKEAHKFSPETSAINYHINKFAEGFANLIGFAGMAPAEALLLPGRAMGVPSPPLGSMIGRGMEASRKALGVVPMQPPSRGHEVLGSVSEAAGASIVPSTAVVARAARPVLAAIPEVLSTAGSGIGLQLGKESGVPGGELMGSVGGGYMGMQKPALMLGKGVPMVQSMFRRGGKYERLAGEELGEAMTSEPRAGINLAQSEDIASRLPGFKPRLSQRTGAGGVSVLEDTVLRKSPERMGEAIAIERSNRSIVQQTLDRMFGGDLRDVRTSAASVLRQSTAKLDQRMMDIRKAEEALSGTLPANLAKQTGEKLLALRTEAKLTADEVVSGLKKDMYDIADRMGVVDDTSDLIAAVRSIGGDEQNIFQNMPPVFGKVLRLFKAETQAPSPQILDQFGKALGGQTTQRLGRDASFQEMHSLYKEINEQYYAAKHVGDSKEMFHLGQLKDVFLNKIKKYEGESFGELKDAFREFNKFYSGRYVPAFVEGTGGRIAATNRFGEVVKPEDIVGKFFTPSGVDDFVATFSDAKTGKLLPDAQRVLNDGVLSLAEKRAFREGRLDASSLYSFLREHKETLERLPNIKHTLLSTARTQEALLAKNANLEAARRQLGESHLAKLSGADDVEIYVAKAMQSPQELRRILSIPGQKAREGAMRSFASNLEVIAERYGMDPYELVMRHEKTLKPFLERMGPQHFENLKLIAGAKTILARSKLPDMGGEIAKRMDPLAEKIGTERSSLINMLRMVLVTRSAQPESMATILVARFLNKEREANVDTALNAAIHDPELAKKLISASKSPESKTLTNAFRSHLYSLGIRSAALAGQE